MPRGSVGAFRAEKPLDDVERAIDAGRDSSRGHDLAVINETLRFENFGPRCHTAQQLEGLMMRRGAKPIEEAGLSKHECTGADAHYDFGVFGFEPNPLEEGRLVQQSARTETAGDNQYLRRGAVLPRKMWDDFQAIAGAHRAEILGHREDIEHRAAAQFVGNGEHFKRSGEVENLDIVEE